MTRPPISPVRVVKLGGSLLGEADRWPRLWPWLTQLANECHHVVITGGGVWADAIRSLDSMQSRSKMAESHWLAVRAMSLTARLCASMESEALLVTDLERLRDELSHERCSARFLVFDPASWLRVEEERRMADRLPMSWDVTSDSIAAHLAHRLEAAELVLLKSISSPVIEATKKGSTVVDPYFSVAYRGTPLEICNYRDVGYWIEATPRGMRSAHATMD